MLLASGGRSPEMPRRPPRLGRPHSRETTTLRCLPGLNHSSTTLPGGDRPGHPSVPPRGQAGCPTCGLWVRSGWPGPGMAGFVVGRAGLWCPEVSAGGDCGRLAVSSGGSLQAPGCGVRSWGHLAPGLSPKIIAARPHEQPWRHRRGCGEPPVTCGADKVREPWAAVLVETALLETGVRERDMQTGARGPRRPLPGQSRSGWSACSRGR